MRYYPGVLLFLLVQALQLYVCKAVSLQQNALPVRLETVTNLFNLVLENKRVLVNFYNANDLHSKLVDFEFSRAAQVIHPNPKYVTKLAVFDVTHINNNSDVGSLCKEYEIKARDFPHLRYFVDHDMHKARRYDGSRHENGIIKWIQLQEEPSVFAISNAKTWQQFIKSHTHTLIAYLPPSQEKEKEEGQYKEFLTTFDKVAQAHRKWNDTSFGFGVVRQTEGIVAMNFSHEYQYRGNDTTWWPLDLCDEGELSHIAQSDPYVQARISLGLQAFSKPRVILYQRVVNPHHVRYNRDFREIEFMRQPFQAQGLFEALMDFIEQETLPMAEEIDGKNYQRYMKYHNPYTYQYHRSDYKAMVWIALTNMTDPNEAAFVQDVASFYYDVAQRYKYQGLLFAIIDFGRFPKHVQMLGIPSVPALLIVQGPNKFLYPSRQSILSASDVHDFFARFLRDMLPVYRVASDDTSEGNATFVNDQVKADPTLPHVSLPANFDPNATLTMEKGVYLVNGRNVDNALIAWNARAHIFMCYYANNDSPSRQFLLELQKIARHVSQDNWLNESGHKTPIIVMQIDCINNDCPETIGTFPHVRFYAKNSIHSFLGGIGLPVHLTNNNGTNDIRFYKGGAGLQCSGA
ncbi:hypothetical protein RFI_09577 [Reticulomyxa filosa]|uniref:Thioredoxin domain-containing protein n=1 Tax=Reticulomyxa filosa TaxID=46433 RepID=X6NMR9_RETFI|nr:hypothetical protein RFI_09577 [Reticulomyxa filosa]|eukprot:ETO27555.1 hypothetical protein RFI_09577 [Reticulomyxa filosa]